jgi:hypothetical protein
MQKASELRKSLANLALPGDEVDRIVTNAIDRGEAEDDNDFNFDPSMIKSLGDDLRAALASVGYDDDSVYKSHLPEAQIDDDDEFIDVEATLGSVVNSTNAQSRLIGTLIKSQIVEDGKLAKGILALGQLTEMNLNAVSSLAKSLGDMHSNLSAVMQRLNVPVPPRAVRGATEAIPHPGEAVAKGDGTTALLASVPTPSSLMAKAKKEQRELSKSHDPEDLTRGHQLSAAISQLEAGVSADIVAAEFNLTA